MNASDKALEALRDTMMRLAALSGNAGAAVRLASVTSVDVDVEHWRFVYSEIAEIETRASNLLRLVMRAPPEAKQRRLPIDTLEE